MRTASYISNQQHLTNKKLSSTQKLYSKKIYQQSSHSKNKYVNSQKNKEQIELDKILKNFTKSKQHLNQITRKNSLNSTAQKKIKKQLFAQSIEKNQQNQITKNLESQAKAYLKFVQQLLNSPQHNCNISKHQKIRINQWIIKLQQPMHNDIWRQNRNFYLKVLIQMIAYGNISQPYSNVPPDGQLPKLTLYDIAFPIRERLIQQKYQNTNQKTRQKSRKNSIQKYNKENNQNLENTNKSNLDTYNSTKKIKAGTKFIYDFKSGKQQNYQKSLQNINKIHFISTNKNKNKGNDNSSIKRKDKQNSSVQMIKRKIFNQIENFSSINKNQNQMSNFGLIINESSHDSSLEINKKKGKNKQFYTMKTQEFMKSSVEAQDSVDSQKQKYLANKEQEKIQKGINVLSQLQLLLWQRQKRFKNNSEYKLLMKKISQLLNKANKQTFQQSEKNSQKSRFNLNFQSFQSQNNKSTVSNSNQSLDISKMFNQQSQSNSFKILSQKVRSKFNKTGKDTKQFLDFLRSYHN